MAYLSKFIDKYASITAPLRKLTEEDVKFKWGPTEQTAFEQFKESITDDETMIYFHQKKKKKKKIVRAEASYLNGLSAGLYQKINKGLQQVHFISRTMTKTEKKYSPTEKDALAVRWEKTGSACTRLAHPSLR